jgi:hypothetical protein
MKPYLDPALKNLRQLFLLPCRYRAKGMYGLRLENGVGFFIHD